MSNAKETTNEQKNKNGFFENQIYQLNGFTILNLISLTEGGYILNQSGKFDKTPI